MSYITLTIDSLRHALHKDQWVVLLEDKQNHRCLPVYINKHWADLIGKALMNKPCDDVIDAEIEAWIRQIRDSGGKVALVIDEDDGHYRARFIGRGHEVECGVSKGLLLCAKAGGPILVEENVLEEAGIAAGGRRINIIRYVHTTLWDTDF